MDFGLREWLLILGPIIVVGVLLHGYWRMRVGRNQIKMKLDKSYVSNLGEERAEDDLSMLRAELPNGGARVIKKPEQQHLDLNDDVPVLMDPVDVDDLPPVRAERDAPEIEEVDPATVETVRISPERAAVLANAVMSESEVEELQSSDDEDDRILHDPDRLCVGVPEKFMVLYVISGKERFPGQQLLEALVSAGMAYGEMDIFHRMGPGGYTQFSLANAVEPGTFDLKTLDGEEIPGVTLFMRVHELLEPAKVYDEMVAVAQQLASELDGAIKDDRRSDLTQQTIAHQRQEILDWQHKHR